MSVVIVGGGIAGLSSAYWLVKAGIGVTVVEQGPVPNPVAASSDHHRLIRFAYGERTGYAVRMPDAFAAWRAMWADLVRPEAHYYAPTGVLSVSLEQGDGADRSLRTLRDLDLPHERLEGGDIASRLPFTGRRALRASLAAR